MPLDGSTVPYDAYENDAPVIVTHRKSLTSKKGRGRTIKAIQTEYNGYIFRSRLEARWAVFFDALGVEYEYEPEGFELPSGKRYLPDFRVKCNGVRGFCSPSNKSDLCGCCRHNGGHLDSYAYQGDCMYALNAVGDVNNNGLCRSCDNFKDSSFYLYVEVKGPMTQKDADKIIEFAGVSRIDYSYGTDNDRVHPTLVVGNVPRDFNDMCYQADEPMNGISIYPYNYETIDGDYFGAYPTALRGRFYLMGADSNYTDSIGIKSLNAALKIARQARFEHGETPTRHEVRRRYAAEMR